MSIIGKLIYLTFMTLSQTIINPIYWIAVLIIYMQYRKVTRMEENITGTIRESIGKRVFSSALVGFAGGMIGSLIMIALGITIEANDFKYILILAILLMLIHPRFICFSYSGGIISLSSLIIGYPKVNVSSVVAIVAVLHLIESMLILFNGDKNKLPIFIERRNIIVGGFSMIRFWPLPFIVLLISTQIVQGTSISMPEWWPLFKPDGLIGTDNKDLLCIMIPVIAILGYGDISITSYPKEKIKKSSRNLFIFSIILLLLSVLSIYLYPFKYVAALFSPLAHEFVIQLGRKMEEKGSPLFIPSNRGVRILDVLPNGIAERIGLKTGCVIFRINGFEIRNIYEIEQVLSTFPSYIWIDFYTPDGMIKTVDYKDYRNRIKNLGIIIVPENSAYTYTVKEAESYGLRVLKWIIRKFK